MIKGLPERDWKEEQRLRDEWARWVAQWPWQYFVTLRLPEKCSCEGAEIYLKGFRENIRDGRFGECAYMGIYNRLPNPHVHLLMLGFDANRYEDALLAYDLEKLGRMVTRRTVEVEAIYHREGIVEYITKKNSPNGHYERITDHGVRLLKKSAPEGFFS